MNFRKTICNIIHHSKILLKSELSIGLKKREDMYKFAFFNQYHNGEMYALHLGFFWICAMESFD